MTITTLTITVTPPPPDPPQEFYFTSYATLAEADKRMLVDPVRGGKWDLLDDNKKKSYLLAATNRLDLLLWRGSKTGGAEQDNAWPRTAMEYCDGTPVATDEVPIDVEVATIIQAGSIVLDPGVSDAGGSGTNIKSVGAGSASVSFFQPKVGGVIQDVTVGSLLRCYLQSSVSGGGSTGPLSSGTGSDSQGSSFSDPCRFGVNRGYA